MEAYVYYKNVDDTKALEELKEVFADKRVMLIAPGKSIVAAMKEIERISEQEDVITIGLNTILDINDYLLTTRQDIYTQAVAAGKNVLVCSNVSKGGRGNVKILNYSNWIELDERTHDSSAVIALNLLKECGVKNVLLAGFDGFSTNINENYFDPNMRRPVNNEQAERRNKYYKNFIKNIDASGVKVKFVTESKYAF